MKRLMALLLPSILVLAPASLVLAPASRADAGQLAAPESNVRVTVDASALTTPFPHFWETTFGSGRAVLSLRQDYRDDLRAVKQVTELGLVRFHGIFMDDVGVYDPGRKVIQFAQTANAKDTRAPGASGDYNFSYVDQIYDGLLANGVRPFVEISFMPRQMASDPNALHAFWYKQNVSPPKDYKLWDAMISNFAEHLIARYGIDEVSKWPFEVWNEPNIDFWVGTPKQSTYFTLYDHTARALKSVNARLRVGGPSTAQAAWVAAFLKHCKDESVSVDFASTHVYANDTAKDVLGTDEQIEREHMVARSVQKVHQEILASPFPKLPLIFSEYNASYANEPNVTDSIYMGPWLASNISQCDGLTESMSYWTFSDVFEEQGVVRTPFYGGFGLVAVDGIQKPAFNAFAMLHRLGSQRYKLDSDSVLATRTVDGSLAVALWNYAPPVGTGAAYTPPPATPGAAKSFALNFTHVRPDSPVLIWRLDADHGNVIKAYDGMGRPEFPSREQIAVLRAAGKAADPEPSRLQRGTLMLSVPPQGLVLITLVKNH